MQQRILAAARRYQRVRKSLGSRSRVAKALGVDRATMYRREAGTVGISREATLAMERLLQIGI